MIYIITFAAGIIIGFVICCVNAAIYNIRSNYSYKYNSPIKLDAERHSIKTFKRSYTVPNIYNNESALSMIIRNAELDLVSYLHDNNMFAYSIDDREDSTKQVLVELKVVDPKEV